MKFRTLESRIVTLFLALILMGQGIGFFVIRHGIINNEQAALHDQLALGVPLFKRLLDQKAQTLISSARAVAKDYGFRQAIASNDKETIESVLTNTQERIDASLALFIGLDQQIKATTTNKPPGNLEQSILQLLDQAEQNDGAAGISIFENKPYQVLVVPVRAPVTIGYVAMAFQLDKKLASDMRDLSLLDVSFLVSSSNDRWSVVDSTLSEQDAASVKNQLSELAGTGSDAPTLVVHNSNYSARILTLIQHGQQRAIVVFQRSIDEAIAPYRKLQLNLILITGFVTLIAFLFSFIAARRIASPLRELTEVAKRLGDGDYESPVQINGDDEIRKLSIAFESMRDGIARHEMEIRRLAYWDTLTNLPNREQFRLMLNEAIIQSKAQQSTCFVLMMDLDRFKNVNDILGHGFGDQLLKQVALRLTRTAGQTYRVARLGGDEFAVLMPQTSAQQAQEIAARILLSLEEPMTLEDQNVDISAGIGLAGYPMHAKNAELLMSRAEVAMYAAKLSSNEAVLYDPVMDRSSEQSLSLLSDLRLALDRHEFIMFVQPKMSLIDGTFIGLESLVRWHHPVRGMIYPDQFIPFSEKTGFIRLLTRWMLEQSAQLCSELNSQGIKAKISVNLSTRDLLDQNLPTLFSNLLTRHDISAASFCLEITESSIMDDPVRALQTLEGLHATGVELSIDDFGTGYSSLAYLKRLPVDELKIDKSFVIKMESDEDDAKIVRSTIDLGHNLGLRVVAEGIETAQAWAMLAKMGCDQGQGYFISQPFEASLLTEWIGQWEPPEHLITASTAQDC